MADNVKFPFGNATVLSMTASGDQDFTITDNLTVVDGVTVEATAARTINLTINTEVPAGAMLLVQSKTNATEATNFGTSITSAALTGVAGKTINQLFIYNGTAFVAAGADQQID